MTDPARNGTGGSKIPCKFSTTPHPLSELHFARFYFKLRRIDPTDKKLRIYIIAHCIDNACFHLSPFRFTRSDTTVTRVLAKIRNSSRSNLSPAPHPLLFNIQLLSGRRSLSIPCDLITFPVATT